jgi:hypothetical protein
MVLKVIFVFKLTIKHAENCNETVLHLSTLVRTVSDSLGPKPCNKHGPDLEVERFK